MGIAHTAKIRKQNAKLSLETGYECFTSCTYRVRIHPLNMAPANSSGWDLTSKDMPLEDLDFVCRYLSLLWNNFISENHHANVIGNPAFNRQSQINCLVSTGIISYSETILCVFWIGKRLLCAVSIFHVQCWQDNCVLYISYSYQKDELFLISMSWHLRISLVKWFSQHLLRYLLFLLICSFERTILIMLLWPLLSLAMHPQVGSF